MDGHEGRAEAVDAGKVLVAARLVDRALAAELGFERLHRDAIGFDAAIAAAFADEFVDDDALVGIGIFAALAAAALLGGAGLIVDQHRRAGNCAELLLDRDEIVARAQRHAGRPIGPRGIFADVVGDDDDLPGAVGGDLPRDLRHVEAAFVALAAGHRHRVVEQDFVGDVDLGIDRPAQARARRNDCRCRRRDSGTHARAWRNATRRSNWRLRRPSGCSRRCRDPYIAP